MPVQTLHLYIISLLLFTFSTSLFAQPDSVNISTFSGQTTEFGIDVNWTTEGEHNVIAFIIERSLDAVVFHEVSTLLPETNTDPVKKYAFTDNNIYRELVYYRISVQLPNGFERSNVIAVHRSDLKDLPDIMVFPSVTSHIIHVVKNSEEIMPDAQIRIFNLSGNLLFDKAVADDFLTESIDVSGFDAGAYILEYYKGQYSTKAKFVKQH